METSETYNYWDPQKRFPNIDWGSYLDEDFHDRWQDYTGRPFLVHRWNMGCRDGCAIHAPSNHHMKCFPQVMRTDPMKFGLIERICECGVGHPDPDSLAYYETLGKTEMSVHGCCELRCCL